MYIRIHDMYMYMYIYIYMGYMAGLPGGAGGAAQRGQPQEPGRGGAHQGPEIKGIFRAPFLKIGAPSLMSLCALIFLN